MEHQLIIGKPDGSWTSLAHMGSKVELNNRMATAITAITFTTKQPFAMLIVDIARSGQASGYVTRRKVSRTENHGLTLTEMQQLTANVEAA